jgi:hypothetical protein
MYCNSCGRPIAENTRFCSECLQAATPSIGISPKSRLVVTLLAYFLGVWGVHRFYLGKIGSGIAMILTFGGFGIWALIDFIFAIIGEMKDKDGLYIKKWE